MSGHRPRSSPMLFSLPIPVTHQNHSVPFRLKLEHIFRALRLFHSELTSDDPTAAPAGTSTALPAAKRAKVQMPDEYLPPNNVLFIQNLPEGTTQEDLREVFELYVGVGVGVSGCFCFCFCSWFWLPGLAVLLRFLHKALRNQLPSRCFYRSLFSLDTLLVFHRSSI